ncbi:MAG: hypothetical protein Q8N59_00630 [bacterium]|nr:hypothetical protein [bacterium]
MENNSEKPHFEKLVGLSKEERPYQEGIEGIVSRKLTECGGKTIEKFEIDKTGRDIEVIDFVKGAVGEYTGKYTEKKYNIPLQNIHVFNPGGVEEFTEQKLVVGASSIERGSIVVDRVESDTAFAMHVFHEILHLNSYTALQLKGKEEPSIETYRSGIEVIARNGEKIFFRDIEEAVIELLTRRFYQENIITNEVFDEEDKKNFPICRVEERAKLEALIDVLWEGNKNRFKTKEGVEDLFLEAQFTGNLLKIGRLIEKTFGKGSFRKLGEGNLIKTES